MARASRLSDQDFAELKKLLNEGNPPSKVPEPIYKASVDGFTEAAFHQKCNNVPGTIVFIWVDNGAGICGGRTSVAWNVTANGQYAHDAKAYLFQLKANGAYVPNGKLLQNSPTDPHSIYCHASYGPTFGAGHDLHVQLTNRKIGPSSSSFKAPSPPFSTTNTLMEVEVFAADAFFESPPSSAPDKPKDMFEVADDDSTLAAQRQEYLENLGAFEVAYPGVEYANILLFGHAGAGKSSFIRCVDTIMQNRFSYVADTGTGTASLTRALKRLQLAPSARGMKKLGIQNLPQEFKLALWDTMGWSNTAYQHGELNCILDGNVPKDFEFDDATSISPRSPGYIRDPTLGDQIHVVLLLVAASEACTSIVASTIKKTLVSTRRRGIRTLLVLTKIDELDKRLATQPHLSDHSDKLKELVTAAAAATGIAESDVFAIKNYSTEKCPTLKVDLPVLRVLEQAMYAAEDYFRGLPSPDERSDRRSAPRDAPKPQKRE